MEKTIIVTGGAGFIGSHTYVELFNAGHEAVIADNFYNASPRVLERFETTEKEYDVDTLLLYEDGVDTAALAKAAQMLTDNGQSVLVQKKNTGNVKYKQLLCMKDRGLEIVAELD